MSGRRPGPGSKLEGILEEVVFIPTPAMRKAKAAFVAAAEDNPILLQTSSEGGTSLAAVQSVVGDSRLTKWWSTPGFRDWFNNKDEFRQRVEYLANLSLDTIEDILLDGDANPSSRMTAAKLMMEAANKLPKGGSEKYLDAQIAEMGKRELEAYLRRHGALQSPNKKQEKK